MLDITKKIETLRTATASAVVKMKNESILSVQNNTGPKKDILATARAAGFLAVKNTSSTIPHCHPIPVEFTGVDYEFTKDKLKITVTVKSAGKTGCEMEALYGASVAALTVYDMLKPIDKSIEIQLIKLEIKSGGKSDFTDLIPQDFKTAVVVISDSVSSGKKKDKAGLSIKEKLEKLSIPVSTYQIIPDEPAQIEKLINELCSDNYDLILTTGGTGLSPRDVTPDTLKKLIEREVEGIMEAARSYGQKRTPYAMLSRGIAGFKGKTLIITLPGSSRGAEESMDALFPYVLHIYKVLDISFKHEKKKE